jgi:hypothetical protein
MKLIKYGFLLFYLLIIHQIHGQEKNDLYYAQPANTGLYLGFMYVNAQNFVLVGVQELFLFNRQKLLVDTLHLSYTESSSFLDNVNHASIIDKDLITVSTLRRSILVTISDDQFKLISDYNYKDLIKQLGKYDLFIQFKSGILARSRQGKVISHYYFSKQGIVPRFTKVTTNLTPNKPDVTQFKGSEVIGFSNYQSDGDDIFIFNRKKNMLIEYNTKTGEAKEIMLPPVNAGKEVHEFYVDSFTGNCYLIKITDNNENKMFIMKRSDYSFNEILSTKYIIRGVFDGKFYVSGIFDGAVAHFLIPIQGRNPVKEFIENE